MLNEPESIHDGHQDIRNDQVKAPGLQLLQSVFTINGGGGGMATARQQCADEAAVFLVVVYYQYLHYECAVLHIIRALFQGKNS
jgi:hypothetical protein